jgi:hypothetical protein
MEQKQTKRRVGRPVGSGMIDDDPPLIRVAEILLDQPQMRPTTAMRQVLRTMPPTTEEGDRTILRRWQSRWRVRSSRYTEQAKAKRQPKATVHRSASGGGYRGLSAMDRVLETFLQADAIAASFRKAEEMARIYDPARMSAFQKAAMGYIDSPLYKAMQEPEFMRRIREQQEIIERMFPKGIGF